MHRQGKCLGSMTTYNLNICNVGYYGKNNLPRLNVIAEYFSSMIYMIVQYAVIFLS